MYMYMHKCLYACVQKCQIVTHMTCCTTYFQNFAHAYILTQEHHFDWRMRARIICICTCMYVHICDTGACTRTRTCIHTYKHTHIHKLTQAVANIANAYASTSHAMPEALASHLMVAAYSCPEGTLEARHIGMLLNALARTCVTPSENLARHFSRSLSALDVANVGGHELSLVASACVKLGLTSGEAGRELMSTVAKMAQQLDDSRYDT
jgi:hypothetical protein